MTTDRPHSVRALPYPAMTLGEVNALPVRGLGNESANTAQLGAV